MKKILNILFIVLFLTMGLVLSVGIFCVGPSQSGANERLSNPPALFNKEGNFNDRFLYDTSVWFNDHFFLRQELISTNNWLDAVLFRTSGEDSVILGSGGWLYYGSTLDDYTGQSPMTELELSAAAKNLELMAQYCQENGKNFAFMIAPNKNSLYPQYMPNYGASSDVHDAHKLISMLKDTVVIDLFEAFSSEEEILYFKTDSHWNSKGAALSADLINHVFENESSYFHAEFTATHDYTGDLFEMLYPAFHGTDTQLHYAGELTYSFTGKSTQPDSITLLTESDNPGTMLVYRDSFGNLLYPYLADSYGAVRFSRSTSYDLTLAADYILIELVERNLRYLITYIPVMPSPVRQMTIPTHSTGTIHAQMNSRSNAPDGLCLWTGVVPRDSGDNIYIQCDGIVYEAFQTADGFAIYLPKDSVPTDVIVGDSIHHIKYTIN